MKKLITVFLMMALVFGLCACGNSGGPEEGGVAPEGLQIGYAKINIIPSPGTTF